MPVAVMTSQPADVIRLTPYGIAMKALTAICDAHEPGTPAHDTAQAALDEAFRRTAENTAAKVTAPRQVAPGQTAIVRVRKRPVEVEAVRWTGGNTGAVRELTGHENFDFLDEQDRANCDDPEATAQVYDKLHSTWVLVFTGQWIIKGVKGEFYPCADDVFRETYESAASAASAAS